jgi:hypothetical protein
MPFLLFDVRSPIGPLSAGRHVVAVHYAGDASFEPAKASPEIIVAPARMRSVRH